ncbi:MAG: tetratricopeptide repeat protein [Anaerolineales bacterium]|nr:tetratricopeptide repeat protein [Anaerolineales bacterium]
MAFPISRQIFLFGALQIQEAQENIPLSGEKAQSLLAYLLLHPVPQGREQLADLLFPDAPFDRVRRNFSDTLYRVQKTLGNDWLLTESETVALCKDKPLWVDVWEFDRLAASPNPGDLQKAITLYTGDLLPTCYDDWILPERELRRNQFLIALENLASHQESTGQLQQALLTTRRLILAEPLHEPAHRTYLRLLGRLQRYAEALAHYEYLCQTLQEELETTPLAETQAIFHALEQERALAARPAPQERMPFIGRATERAALLDAVERTLQGKGGILALEGDAGLGKSRLLREMTAGARWRGATVLQGIASETPEASPFAPLSNALTPLIEPRQAQIESLLPPEILAALAPLYLAWHIHATTETTPRAFTHALRTFGQTLAKLTPLVLILDDMHWASPALWESLPHFAHSLTQHGALLILAYRRAEVEPTIGWEKLQSWDRDGLLTIISLTSLTVNEVARWVEDQPHVDPIILHALTGGNPFRLTEWLAAPEHRAPTGAFTVAQRLAATSPEARQVLECASVLGETLSYPLLAQMVEMPPLSLAAAADELVAAPWLNSSPMGFTFVHDLIRTAIYDQLPEDRRCALHTRAAHVYQTLEPENARSRAFHLDRAGQTSTAAEAYHRAGDQDLARFAYREARAAFDRALALLPPTVTTERVEIMLGLAWASDVLGERTRQIEILAGALSGARQLRAKALELRTLLAKGRALIQAYQFADGGQCLQEALTLAQKLKDYSRQAEAYLLLGMNETDNRRSKQGIDYYTRALKLARKISSLSLEARALRGLGIAARDMGDPKTSIQWLEQALEIHRQAGDRLGEVTTHSNIVTACYDLGAWDQLLATVKDLLPKVEVLGYRYNAGYLRQLQALASFNLGDYGPAREHFQGALKDFQAAEARSILILGGLGLVAEDEGQDDVALKLYREALSEVDPEEDERDIPIIQQDLGTLLWRLEQPHEALPYLEAAREAWIKQEDHLGLLKAETYLALVHLTLGERDQAEALAEQVFVAFQAGFPVGEKAQNWLWYFGLLLQKLGRETDMQTVIRAAYAELQRQACAIHDPELRRGFFTRVPVNRAIVSAYDQLSQTIRQVNVSLARSEAPLGRLLRSDEYVSINWTVNAPEDEAFPDKTAQRHYRLKRLLDEARACGATPTDDDLADALGVSRRTILRDMQTLSEELSELPTRKRK